MENSFVPITRFPIWDMGGYPRHLPPRARYVTAEDKARESSQPTFAEEYVHAGAVTLFDGFTADFLEISSMYTRSHLLWEFTWVTASKDSTGNLAELLQLVAIDSYNVTLAYLQLGEVDRARGHLVVLRDALRGWALAVYEHGLPSESWARIEIADAYIARRPDVLCRVFPVLTDFLDVNGPQ